MAGLPPTTVYAGTLDVLYPDAVRLQQRAQAEGVDLHLNDGAVHTWSLFTFLPGPRAIRSLHHALVGDPA
ncbi:hypothetical protein [Micromonospora sp. DT47]|uniref:hypothetical protein n=1 Tax=Micromonospora sp. DT47 TaxID=3393431 RepID=UPI003CEA6FAE